MTLTVTIDPADRSRLVFSQRLTLAAAIAFLWATPPSSANVLRPDPAERAEAGAQRRFILDTSNQDALLGLQPELMFQYLTITPIRAKEPAPLPAWLPLHVREQILGFSLPDGAHRFACEKPWGDIVVWVKRGRIYMRAEAYQEFPEALEFYLQVTDGDHWTANLLLDVFKSFNADMAYFVEEKGLSPSEARAEIKRINDELFKQVLVIAASIMNLGAGISAIISSMRQMAPEILAAARRMRPPVRIRPLNGQVNVGGGGERPGMTNLNAMNGTSGGPTSNIPDLVRGRMQEMDEIFEPGSVTYIFSSKLHYDDFLPWSRSTQAAANVMRRGGRVEMNVMCAEEGEEAAIVAAFLEAGFQRAWHDLYGPATVIHAIR